MPRNRTKFSAWIVLAFFAAAAVFVLYRTGLKQSLVALATFTLALALIAAVFLLWSAARSWLGRLFPSPPLWRKPRPCSALFEPDLFATLQPRLDLLERDGRLALWQDRTSGQLWRSVASDFEFTENEVFEPLANRADWKQSPAG